MIALNATTSGFGTILPLYMLQLGGTVRDVAIYATLSGLALTFGSMFWGRVIDKMHWRQMVIIISSASMIVLAASIYFISSVSGLLVISALVGFLTAGAGPATNLLVMDRSRKEDWVKTFSWTSLLSNAGIVIAMILGYFWLQYYSAQTYAIVSSVIAAVSLVLTIFFVKDLTNSSRKQIDPSRLSSSNLVLVSIRSSFRQLYYLRIPHTQFKLVSSREGLLFA